jgi:serine phosphatase RsbU (regulator of sigma subunit)
VHFETRLGGGERKRRPALSAQLPDDEDFGQTTFSPRRLPDLSQASDLADYIVVTKGDTTLARIELDSVPLTIGREAGQTIVLADTEVSRRHARVATVDGRVVVEDLGSTNGCFLNGQRLAAAAALKEGSVLRIGSHLLKYERRSRQDVERSAALERDLAKANSYVLALLPPPLTEGPVLVDWRFVPSAQLGGDAFGYYWLDPTTFVFYLLDVSGHGVGSAMHSVTALNVLRQRALPRVDFTNPADVLASLNNRFQMASHNGLFFTMWYGVYRTDNRQLRYASAGHHAAYLVSANRRASQPLGTPALMIGVIPDVEYDVAQTEVPQNSTLHLFSDGVFEIVTLQQNRWSLTDFEPLLLQPALPKVSEPERLYQAVKQAAGPNPLDDDFSLVTLTFP